MPDLLEMDLRQHELASVLAASLPELARFRILQPEGVHIATCIYSTKVALTILRHYGVQRAQPFAVRTTVANPAYVSRMQREGHPARNLVEMERWNKEDGAVLVGCGYALQTKEGTYNGHLVAVAEDYLIDLSCDQFSRPHQGIDLESISLKVTPGFREGRERAMLILDNGCMIVYEKHDDDSWATAPDWVASGAEAAATAAKVIEDITELDELPIPVGRS